MITIEPNYNGTYKMSFRFPKTKWKGYRVEARTLGEVHTAIDHHLGGRHIEHNEACPLCRQVAEKNRGVEK